MLDRPSAPALERIHLVFKTHLDVGFTDLAAKVVDGYFTDYIPRALAVGRALRERGGDTRFVWTTGSWLIHAFFERAGAAERRALEEAIVAGDVVWHALPFTLHSELADPSLFAFGLELSARLDRRFGRTTLAAKMTDVPGHTIGVVPILAASGVRFLHVGVNGASTVPGVPPVFRWRAEDGSEVIVVYEGGGYGGVTLVPGCPSALAFAHTHDNQGPQRLEDVEEAHRALRERFPGVPVVASTLDAFARDLLAARPALPTVTDEIGDSWIHGAGTDPVKVRRFRELARVRRAWLARGHWTGDEPRARRFSERLLMIPEHTWGMDEKEHLDDYARYDAASFEALRAEEKTRRFEASWAEQRAYLDEAMGELEPHERGEIEARLASIAPSRPRVDGSGWVKAEHDRVETEAFVARFDPRHGGLASLVDRASGREWASGAEPLALFRYQVFAAADYERFVRQYMVAAPHDLWWAMKDFTKPGLERAAVPARSFLPRLEGAYRARDGALLLEMRMDGAATALGAPARVTLGVAAGEGGALDLTLQWFDKKACRLPEACWFSFALRAPEPDGWRLRKLGVWVSPRRVVSKGNRTLHAVEDLASYRDAHGGVVLETLDAPLVAPGRPSLLDFHDRLPAAGEGVHVNLWNNVWGTNFPMWSDDDGAFRFRVLRAAP